MCIDNANYIMQNIKVAVDAVVFGYFDKEDLQILLIKRKIDPFKGDGLCREDWFLMMKIWIPL